MSAHARQDAVTVKYEPDYDLLSVWLGQPQVADQVAILDRGRIVRQGPTESLREDVQRLVVPAEVVRKRAAMVPQHRHVLMCRSTVRRRAGVRSPSR
jgi:hypothetical protein